MKNETYKFTRGQYGWNRFGNSMCRHGVRLWVNIPLSANELYITVSSRPSKEAIQYRRGKYKWGRNRIYLLTKSGRWYDSQAYALSGLSGRHKWPKTGYLKVQYAE